MVEGGAQITAFAVTLKPVREGTRRFVTVDARAYVGVRVQRNAVFVSLLRTWPARVPSGSSSGARRTYCRRTAKGNSLLGRLSGQWYTCVIGLSTCKRILSPGTVKDLTVRLSSEWDQGKPPT